jgi:hypothetical protein
LAPAMPALLFFLMFYSLFGPCLARPLIFPYLLLFIWPLPCPPVYFSLFFTLYLAPALPARPCPLPCKTDGQTDLALPPAPPCLVWPPVFPNPVFRIRLSGPVPPRQLKRGTVVGRTDRQTHCCNYIRDILDGKKWIQY